MNDTVYNEALFLHRWLWLTYCGERQELTLGIFYVPDVGRCVPQTLSQLIHSWFSCVCVCVFKLLLYFQCSLVKKRTVLLHSYSYYAVFMGSSLLKTFLKWTILNKHRSHCFNYYQHFTNLVSSIPPTYFCSILKQIVIFLL